MPTLKQCCELGMLRIAKSPKDGDLVQNTGV